MATKIRAYSQTGRTIYIHITNSEGKRWNGTTFETYSSANWTNYDVALTEEGSSGIYSVDFPSAITTAGIYEYFWYIQSGGTPAETDAPHRGSGTIDWNGSTAVSDSGSVDSTYALVTLADVKAFLKITATTENSILSYFINECSKVIYKYCGRENFVSASYTEYYNGNGTRELILRNYPIISITTLNDDTLRSFGSGNNIDITTNVIIKKQQGIIQLWNQESFFEKAIANVKVVYTAGYGTIPQDIQLAAKRLIAIYYFKYVGRRHEVSSESFSDHTVTYLDQSISKDVELLLRSYKQKIAAPDYSYSD